MSKPYDPKDSYYRRAKKEQLRARSAFKIEELQERWKLAKSGSVVVDLGAAPGGFLQVLAQAVGMNGRVVGVDVDAIRPLGGVVATLQMNVMEEGLIAAIRSELGGRAASLVASDLAPKTSGIRETDEARSLALARRALEVALTLLQAGGHFVAKVFMGGDFERFLHETKHEFEDVRIVRPDATRARSREVYVVALRRRGIGHTTDAAKP